MTSTGPTRARLDHLDERLADLGAVGPADSPLALDSLARFELWLLLEDVSEREIPLELVASIETVGELRSWLCSLGAGG